METLKFLRTTILMVVLAAGFNSCGKDDEKIGSTEDLVGKWELTWTKGWKLESDGSKIEWDEADSKQLFVFKKDGTGYETSAISSAHEDPFKWKLNEKKLTLTYDLRSEDVYQVEALNESTLKITISDNHESDTSTYKKASN